MTHVPEAYRTQDMCMRLMLWCSMVLSSTTSAYEGSRWARRLESGRVGGGGGVSEDVRVDIQG